MFQKDIGGIVQAGLGYEMTSGRDMKEIIGQGKIWECENTAVKVGGVAWNHFQA